MEIAGAKVTSYANVVYYNTIVHGSSKFMFLLLVSALIVTLLILHYHNYYEVLICLKINDPVAYLSFSKIYFE